MYLCIVKRLGYLLKYIISHSIFLIMCQYCKPDYYCAVGNGDAICCHLDGLTYMQCPVYVWLSAELRSVESQILDFCRSPECDCSLNYYSFKVFPEVDAPF